MKSITRRTAHVPTLATLALMASCASPQQVQETRELAKAYETQVYDLQRQLAESENDRDRLRRQLQSERSGNLQESGFSGELQTRMTSLESLLDDLGRAPRDIERIDMEGGYMFMIQDKVLFDSGSDELGEDGRQALRALAAEIDQAPHGTIYVRGHTDSDPVKKPETRRRFPYGNLQLAASRAVSVGAFLVDETPVAARDVVVMGFGQWNPLRPNDSADSKRLNRRVEIFISDAPTQ